MSDYAMPMETPRINGGDFDPLAAVDEIRLRQLARDQAIDNSALRVENDSLRRELLDRSSNCAKPRLRLRTIFEIVSERRETKWLIPNILEAEVLAVLAGKRSTFKSFIALDWVMQVAARGLPAVYLSGEGAGLDRRADAWMKIHGKGLELDRLPVFAIERPLNLSDESALGELCAVIKSMQRAPALIVIDTLSKFSPGLDENSNAEVAEFLSQLTQLIRDAVGCAVLLVVHAGHGGSSRPRGASALMANPDAEYIVTRPTSTATTALVSRERFKDYPALGPLAYEVQVVDLDRVDQEGEPVTSLALVQRDQLGRRGVMLEPSGKQQRKLLDALRELHKHSPTSSNWTPDRLREIARGLGMSKSTARSAADALVTQGFLTQTGAAYCLTEM